MWCIFIFILLADFTYMLLGFGYGHVRSWYRPHVHMSVFLLQCPCQSEFHILDNKELTYLLTYNTLLFMAIILVLSPIASNTVQWTILFIVWRTNGLMNCAKQVLWHCFVKSDTLGKLTPVWYTWHNYYMHYNYFPYPSCPFYWEQMGHQSVYI